MVTKSSQFPPYAGTSPPSFPLNTLGMLTLASAGLQLSPTTLKWWIDWCKVSPLPSPSLQQLRPLCTDNPFALTGLQPFSPVSPAFVCDWHFCEFSSSLTFALYTSCVELMTLPLPSNTVSNQLLVALCEK